MFQVNDVVRLTASGEACLVTSVSANSIGVTRSWGSVAAATAQTGVQVVIVGNAFAQAASSGTPRVTLKTRGYNYVQEIRDPLQISYVEGAIESYQGEEPAYELVKKADEHMRSRETTLFLGARDFVAADSPGARGSCGGAIEFISTNVTNVAGNLTPAAFDSFAEGCFNYGSQQDKVFFCGPGVARVLSQMLRGIWQPNTVGERKYGAKVDAFITGAYGIGLPVIVKREWADLGGLTSGKYGSYGFLIDLSETRLRPLRSRNGINFNAALRRNIGEPSATALVHELYTAMSLEFRLEKSHGVLKNITGYSAS